jgi:hypothetical protein
VLVAAKERYQVEVRTEHLAAELSGMGHDVSHLALQLVQLEDWGAVTWTQDTNRVARLEEFRRRRELWHLTPAGQAAHDAVIRVLGAAEQSGSLQRALFRDIRENLEELTAAVDEGDATATYLRLRDLDGALRDLAAAYLRHHLALVGREEPLFADDALALVHRASNGLPRALNNVATAALIAAASRRQGPRRRRLRQEGRRRAHPGLTAVAPTARAPPSSKGGAEPWAPSAADSCADSVAGNRRPMSAC